METIIKFIMAIIDKIFHISSRMKCYTSYFEATGLLNAASEEID